MFSELSRQLRFGLVFFKFLPSYRFFFEEEFIIGLCQILTDLINSSTDLEEIFT